MERVRKEAATRRARPQVDIDFYDDTSGVAEFGSIPLYGTRPAAEGQEGAAGGGGRACDDDGGSEGLALFDPFGSSSQERYEHEVILNARTMEEVISSFLGPLGAWLGGDSNVDGQHQQRYSDRGSAIELAPWEHIVKGLFDMVDSSASDSAAHEADADERRRWFSSSSSTFSRSVQPDGSVVEDRTVRHPDGRIERSRVRKDGASGEVVALEDFDDTAQEWGGAGTQAPFVNPFGHAQAPARESSAELEHSGRLADLAVRFRHWLNGGR
uniref:Uncharacterized protein n=1 Tax=Erythrolobus australicus TaxID=1077150 RepID=A0A7S1TMC8_9RHOD